MLQAFERTKNLALIDSEGGARVLMWVLQIDE